MSMDTIPKPYHAFSPGDKEIKLTTRKSLKLQQSSKKMDEQIKLPRGSEGIKYPGKSRVERDWHSSYFDEGSSRGQDVDTGANQPKSFRNPKSQKMKGDAIENDELVKHMTHLPDYLQHAVRRETLQEKALNVGVLDWSRLEKFTKKSKSLNVSSLQFQSNDNASRTAPNCHENISKTNKLSSRSYPDIAPTRGKHRKVASEMGTSLSGFRDYGDHRADNLSGVKGRVERMPASACKTEEASLSKIRENQNSVSLNKGILEDDGSNKRAINQAASSKKAVEQDCSAKHSSIVLLFPRRRRNSSSLEASQQGDCMKMSHQNLADQAHRSFFSGTCSKELYSGDGSGDFRKTVELLKHLDGTCQVHRSGNEPCEGDSADKNVSNGTQACPRSSSKSRKLQAMDQESAELAARRGRHSSPNRRLSLSGISRSFSYKEGRPALSSTSTMNFHRSDFMTAEDSILTNEKETIYTRSRFSSFRRLFDPILKYKPSSSNNCVEDAEPNLNPLVHSPINSNKSCLAKKQRLTFRALLQLTVMNGGCPLLKFLVENNHQILVCSTKDLTSSGNFNSPGRSYIFYSVDETKKRSGSWVGQGSKMKSGNFVYSEVGHMCATHSQNLFEHTLHREYVLFSSEIGYSGIEKEHCHSMACAEVAAIVSKIRMDACRHDKHQSKYVDLVEGILPGKKCFCNISSEDNSTTVILPGAIHTLPKNGKPSPLINRWRSGGSCDCGGWDVGCKLHVLSNKKVCLKTATPPDSCPTSEDLELFPQGEIDLNGPILSLKPTKKGIYLVEFDSFISSLQAFSICVAFISSQSSSGPLQKSHFTKFRDSQELSSDRSSAMKPPLASKVEGPEGYSQHLPLTPLDRV